MGEIRLNKIFKKYNIGLQSLVAFLKKIGADVEENNPNAKISDSYLPSIEKQFGKDLELKEASEKIDIKLNEILEKSRKQQDRTRDDFEEPVRETVIKSTIFTPEMKSEPKTETASATTAQTDRTAQGSASSTASNAAAGNSAAESAKSPEAAPSVSAADVAAPAAASEAEAKKPEEMKKVSSEEDAQPAQKPQAEAAPAAKEVSARSGDISDAQNQAQAADAGKKETVVPTATAPAEEKTAGTGKETRQSDAKSGERHEQKKQDFPKERRHEGKHEQRKDSRPANENGNGTSSPARAAAEAAGASVAAAGTSGNNTAAVSGAGTASSSAGTAGNAASDAGTASDPASSGASAAAATAQPEDNKGIPGFKVLGKIDMSQFEKKSGKKRERINKGSQKVDVVKEGRQADNNRKDRKDKKNSPAPGAGQQRPGANPPQDSGKGGRKRNRGADRFKPVMSEEEQEAMQKEIQKQVKETYARMNDNKKNNFGAKYRKEKRELAAAKSQEEMAQELAERKILKVTEFVTVNDLATLMNNTPVNDVIRACMELGLMVSINQRLDAEALVLVAEQFGFKVEFVTADLTEELGEENGGADREEDLVSRPPVITVMGHVDHGKTSLLDHIRKSNVIAGEAGGITQHIGAYNVKLPDGRRITFLDTPGHEAFTAMRARGAQLTDLAIIIIAADDAVMPQTVEAINHAQAANVPMVFAINKIDKPGAQPEKIYQQLSQMNILTEAWGGKYQCQEISAKKGLDVDKLLEKVLLETDLLDLKANPVKNGSGAVIESSLDKGRGFLATVLVQNGTLKTGDMVLSGCYYGRVKAMFNERGQKIKEAGPSTPVSVLGLNGAPSAGDKFIVMSDEKEAKAIANKREQLIRIQGIKTQKHMTLEEIGRRIAIGNFKELNVIVKGDVDGSVEALSDSLIKLSTEQVRVNVIHKAVGGISESDVILAEASDAIIIGFQVRPSTDARKTADEQGIEIRLYSVIYDAINDVKDGMEGLLEPIKKEEITGTAEVKQTFKISKVGTIAGCLVRDGKIAKSAKCRLIRDGIVVYTGELSSLKRSKDDVKEVSAGMECGIGIEKFNDIKSGDFIEAFTIIEVKQTL